ncbi:MAG: S8 family serine peptidase [Bacteroidetes bacterium]|nr:S8 family serine peptidase [Bacteroidota bacterium]
MVPAPTYINKEYFVSFTNESKVRFGEPQEPFLAYKEFLTSQLGNNSVVEIRFPYLAIGGELAMVAQVRFTENIEETVLGGLAMQPEILYVERVPEYQLQYVPNDYKSAYWHLSSIGATKAWDYSTGSKNVRLAIIDNAFLTTHEDLSDNIWVNTGEKPNNGKDDDNNGFIDDVNGWDIADNDNNPNPPSVDTFSHGTAVAGLAGAVSDNNKGVASIGYGISIVPIKSSRSKRSTGKLYNPMDGLIYAVSAGAHVINMSWGTYSYSKTHEQLIDWVDSKGIIMVAAAGNGNTSIPMYPAAYDGVLAIGAVSKSDEITSVSNYGKYLDFMAPGENMFTASALNTSDYDLFSGTSMAAPLVAGTLSLMKSAVPSAQNKDLIQALELTTRPVKNLKNPKVAGVGHGIIDAGEALKLVAGISAKFLPSSKGTCPGGYVDFVNISSGLVIKYRWEFEGGSPKRSTQANPSVYYPTSGSYGVKLVVWGASEVDSVYIPNYITVGKPTAELSGGGDVNAGSTVLMKVDLTGNGPWSIGFSDGTNSQVINDITYTPYYFTALPKDTVLYSLDFVSDAYCYGEIKGTALFNLVFSKKACITLQPGANDGKDAMIKSDNKSSNLHKIPDYAGWSWQLSSALSIGRGFIDFDLSGIPKGAKIKSASLSLYHSNSSNAGQAGDNASYLRRIIEPWNEVGVTWANQPATSPLNQVRLPKSTSQTQDYVDIDVTDLIIDMVNYPDSSYGIMIRNVIEKSQKSLKFFSSDGSISSEWPKLEVCYEINGGSTQKKCEGPVANYKIATGCLADSIDFISTSVDTSGKNLVFAHWDFGDGTTLDGSFTPKHKYDKKGVYDVMLVVFNDASPACMDTFIKQVRIDNTPVIHGPDTVKICLYDSLITDTFLLDCAAEPYVVNWSNTSWVANPAKLHTKISSPYSGYISLTVKDNFGNLVTKKIFVEVDNNCCQSHAGFAFSKSLVCYGDKVNIKNESVSSKGKTSYFWTFSKYANVSAHNGTTPPAIEFLETGYHPVKLILVDDCGIDSITQYIPVLNKPTFNLPSDTNFCKGADTFKMELTNVSNYRYAWKPKALFTNPNSASTDVVAKDTVTISLKVVDSESGCQYTKYMKINRFENTPTVNLGPDTIICVGQKLLLYVAQNDAKYKWSTGDSAQFITVTAPDDYFVHVWNGCGSVSDTVNVQQLDKPTVKVYGPKEYCDSATLYVTGKFLDYVYWNTNEVGKVIHPKSKGLYWVKTLNICGEATAYHLLDSCTTIGLDYLGQTKPFAYVVNPLTPNGDGVNDVLYVGTSPYRDFHITVYNTLGYPVFETSDPSDMWDGSYQGHALPSGNYFFRLYVSGETDGQVYHTSGVVLLMR